MIDIYFGVLIQNTYFHSCLAMMTLRNIIAMVAYKSRKVEQIVTLTIV